MMPFDHLLYWSLFVSGGCVPQAKRDTTFASALHTKSYHVDFTCDTDTDILFQLPSSLQCRREGL